MYEQKRAASRMAKEREIFGQYSKYLAFAMKLEIIHFKMNDDFFVNDSNFKFNCLWCAYGINNWQF